MAGIYIHIPFCKQPCTYCNFHFSTSLLYKKDVLEALVKEISLTIPFPGNKEIDTVYIGGGTPSILAPDELLGILQQVSSKFSIAEDAEITLEANPDDINKEALHAWEQIGINRLSVGIQSFVEAELVWMNRAHNANQSLQCIDAIEDSGFTNFSVDLIYGSPLLSNEALENNLEILFQKKIPHISCYALTVEPKTPLYKLTAENRTLPVDAAHQSFQFRLVMDRMKQMGYEHYEISNFAKPGMRSRHNSSYWQGKPYYGFGPSAHSFNGGNVRRWNIANNALYLQALAKGMVPFEEEILTPAQQLNEYIMISLRTVEGLDVKLVEECFGEAAARKVEVDIQQYVTFGKVLFTAGKMVLTDEGKLFADGIAADLFS